MQRELRSRGGSLPGRHLGFLSGRAAGKCATLLQFFISHLGEPITIGIKLCGAEEVPRY